MTHYYTINFAAAYGEGSYGSCTYADTSSTSCAATTGTTGKSGGLADTGTLVILFASIACLIIFVAFVVRIWKRKPALQTVQAANGTDADRTNDTRS